MSCARNSTSGLRAEPGLLLRGLSRESRFRRRPLPRGPPAPRPVPPRVRRRDCSAWGIRPVAFHDLLADKRPAGRRGRRASCRTARRRSQCMPGTPTTTRIADCRSVLPGSAARAARSMPLPTTVTGRIQPPSWAGPTPTSDTIYAIENNQFVVPLRSRWPTRRPPQAYRPSHPPCSPCGGLADRTLFSVLPNGTTTVTLYGKWSTGQPGERPPYRCRAVARQRRHAGQLLCMVMGLIRPRSPPDPRREAARLPSTLAIRKAIKKTPVRSPFPWPRLHRLRVSRRLVPAPRSAPSVRSRLSSVSR